MLDGKIEFDSNWILENRNTEPLPVATVIEKLRGLYGDRLTVDHEDFALLTFSISSGAVEQTAQQINSLLQKQFNLSDGRQLHDSATSVYYVYPELMLAIGAGTPSDNVSPLSFFDSMVGWDEFKVLCKEISLVAPQIRNHNTQISFQHQNYLFAVNDGAGLTTALNTFVDFITALDLFPFCKDAPVQEIRLDAKSEDGATSPYDAIARLGKLEYRNSLVCFDIRALTQRAKINDLKAFLRQLLPYESDYIFAFRVSYIEPNALKSIQDIISDILFLRTVSVPPYTNEQLKKGAILALGDYNFTVSDDAWDVFFSRIAEEKSDGRFYGMQSVRKIVCEILWLKHLADSRNADAEASEVSSEGSSSDVAPSESNAVITKDDILGLSSTYSEHRTSGFDELSELIGMEAITERIREIVSQVTYALKDKSLDRPTLHMRFTGAPGTGKTTVARILGRIFAENGILRNGYFFEYMSRDLCGEYVGQTAPKTASICRDAYGSVLFIDEAYALYSGESNSDYGKEALATLISEMENHRDDMVVIMAGYKDDMDKLMEGNAGLRSRMPYQIDFPGYTKQQLTDIFMLMVKKHFSYDNDLEQTAKNFFFSLDQNYMDSPDFANARFVRNLYERTWSKAAIRSQINGLESITITSDDFRQAASENEFSERLQTRHTLGFL